MTIEITPEIAKLLLDALGFAIEQEVHHEYDDDDVDALFCFIKKLKEIK